MKKYDKFIKLLKEEASVSVYNITNSDSTWFEFDSIGKTTIRKVVEFQQYESCLYNIAFGDLTGITQKEINEDNISDNGDIKEIFSTIIRIVDIFFDLNPGVYVSFLGNTKQKNNIYFCNFLYLTNTYLLCYHSQ